MKLTTIISFVILLLFLYASGSYSTTTSSSSSFLDLSFVNNLNQQQQYNTYIYNITTNCSTHGQCYFPNNATFTNNITTSLNCSSNNNIIIFDTSLIYNTSIPIPPPSNNTNTTNTTTTTSTFTAPTTYYITINSNCNINYLILNGSNLNVDVYLGGGDGDNDQYQINNINLYNGSTFNNSNSNSMTIDGNLTIYDNSSFIMTNSNNNNGGVETTSSSSSSSSPILLINGNITIDSQSLLYLENITLETQQIGTTFINGTINGKSVEYKLTGTVILSDDSMIDNIDSQSSLIVQPPSPSNSIILNDGASISVNQISYMNLINVIDDGKASISTNHLDSPSIQLGPKSQLSVSPFIESSPSSSPSYIKLRSLKQEENSISIFTNITTLFINDTQVSGELQLTNVTTVQINDCPTDSSDSTDMIINKIQFTMVGSESTQIQLCNTTLVNITQQQQLQQQDDRVSDGYLIFAVSQHVEIVDTAPIYNGMIIIGGNSSLTIKNSIDMRGGNSNILANASHHSHIILESNSTSSFDLIQVGGEDSTILAKQDSMLNVSKGLYATNYGTVHLQQGTYINGDVSLSQSTLIFTCHVDGGNSYGNDDGNDDRCKETTIDGNLSILADTYILMDNNVNIGGHINFTSGLIYLPSGKYLSADSVEMGPKSVIGIMDPISGHTNEGLAPINLRSSLSINASLINIHFSGNAIVPSVPYIIVRSQENITILSDLLGITGQYNPTLLEYSLDIEHNDGYQVLYIEFNYISNPTSGLANWKIGLIIFCVFIFLCCLFGVYKLYKKRHLIRYRNQYVPIISDDSTTTTTITKSNSINEYDEDD